MRHPYWPVFDIRVTTPRLELRLPTDDDITEIIEQARNINGAPGVFMGGWSALEEPEFSRGIAQFHWQARASWVADGWQLPFSVVVDGHVVGLQDVGAVDFCRLREVSTGSWLNTAHQGAGLGAEMRSAVLHFAFVGLGAKLARSSARGSNLASLGVSDKLGYARNGTLGKVFGDNEVDTEIQLMLTRAQWETTQRDDIEITGLEGCLDLFGA